MTKTTEALNGADFARHYFHLTHAIENGDTSAEERGVGGRVGVGGNADGGFAANDAVFGD